MQLRYALYNVPLHRSRNGCGSNLACDFPGGEGDRTMKRTAGPQRTEVKNGWSFLSRHICLVRVLLSTLGPLSLIFLALCNTEIFRVGVYGQRGEIPLCLCDSPPFTPAARYSVIQECGRSANSRENSIKYCKSVKNNCENVYCDVHNQACYLRIPLKCT
jgi:hypothetical protein